MIEMNYRKNVFEASFYSWDDLRNFLYQTHMIYTPEFDKNLKNF